jgi:uncharacterized protein (DUF302 family)
MKAWRRMVLLGALLTALPLAAEELMMVRSPKPFTEAMAALQESIDLHGYTVMRVQRVDVGLKSRGFATAEYRVVFFGDATEVQTLSQQHPELMPFLPLKITLFAEGDTTLAVTNSPLILASLYKDPDLQPHFKRWEKTVREIMDDLMLGH